MKKNILFIVAALFLFLGNQSLAAQAKMEKEVQSENTDKIEAKAMKKATDLVRPLGLNKKQQEQVYFLFLKTESKMSKSAVSADAKTKGDVMQSKVDKYIMGTMKEILSEEQFKKYLELSKNL